MLNLNADYGTEKNALPTGDATWQGIAGIAKYDFSEMYSIAVRAEYFDDKDGFRTGTEQKLKEVTITPQVQLVENFLMRPEYRHDWSDKDVFDNNTSDSQDTLSFSVMYTW
jgi:maltoporin